MTETCQLMAAPRLVVGRRVFRSRAAAVGAQFCLPAPPRTIALALGAPSLRSLACTLALAGLSSFTPHRTAAAQQTDWPVHSLERPRPIVVDPGPAQPPVPAPSDAIVLFDGKELAEWRSQDGTAARWRVSDGYVEVAAGTGSIVTRRSFGDLQLHIEWATPNPPSGEGQERGNSGVFLMRYYEIQVLDSYRNDTYPDGQAAALFGQAPPLVNACRAPGAWQTYEIIFRRPRFAADGALVEPGRVTVLHNGVLVHDAAEFGGRTVFGRKAQYEPHPDRLPLMLQDHGQPVRFRNIWVRDLEPTES